MKFQLPSLRLIGKILVTLLALVALGLLLIVLAYTFSTDKIKANVAESAYTFYEEGSYPRLSDSSTSTLDSFTDALMLLTAAYDGPESTFQKALQGNYWVAADIGDAQPEAWLISLYASNPDGPVYKVPYSRYWHGYLVFLKPLLTVFNYDQIRTLNRVLQFLLTAAIIVFMCIKKCIKAIPAFIVSLLMINPVACAYCLQYSSIAFIFLVFSLLLLLLNDKMASSKDAIYLFFLILGAATSYIDFLTYPVATFCMVATMYICVQRDNVLAVDFRNIINLIICWGIGYGVMFASKWVLATWFTEFNIINDAIITIKSRAGNEVAGVTIDAIQTFKRTFDAYFNTPYRIIALIVLIIEVLVLVFSKAKFRWNLAISYLLVLVIPLIWYICVPNHSYMHAFFTNKALVGSMFALLCIFIVWDTPSKYNSSPAKKKKSSKKK